MSIAYIRGFYGVPAKRGARVTWRGAPGTIISAKGQYVAIRKDDGRRIQVHPTDDDLVYLDAEGGPK
jgi:hypothetical protein